MNQPIHSLDARYYTDPEIFAREQTRLFAHTWQFACHLSDLPTAGCYTSFEIGGEALFAVRGRDHQVRVFYNVCQHRAHQLVSGAGRSPTITCPYHAWSYDFDGALRAAPNLNVVAGADKSKICLTEVRCEEFLGFLFVNLDMAAAPIESWFPGVRAELEEWVPNWAALKPLEWVEIPEKCNWKVSVENYSECYHCALNHMTFSNGVVKPETYDIQPKGKCLRHPRSRAAQHKAVAKRCYAQCTAHYKGKARVPRAGNVEEVDDLGRVGHARDGDANAKDEADEVAYEKTHDYAPMMWRITKTVRAVVIIKVMVAAMDRPDRRAMPQTP